VLIALTGATGYVGRFIVERLLRHDHALRVLARREGRAGWMRDRGVEVVPGDLASPAALRDLVAGAGAVVHLVGIIEEVGRQSFQRVHIDGTRAVLDAAHAAGVARFVHMSALGARATLDATAYHRSKAQAEALVAASGLSCAIMRPSLIAEEGNAVLTLLLRMLRFAPVVPIIGDGAYRLQPVAADDVAEAFAVAVEHPALVGKFDLAGPDALTYNEMVGILESELGVTRPRVHVPVAAARAGAMLGTLVPLISPITPSQLTMLLEGNTTDRNALATTFGIAPRPFRDVARDVCRPYRPAAPPAAPPATMGVS
jgi:NADH dehydrogenase